MVKQKQTSIQAIFSLLKSTVILDLLLSTVNKIIPFLFFLCLEMKQKIVQNFKYVQIHPNLVLNTCYEGKKGKEPRAYLTGYANTFQRCFTAPNELIIENK